MGLMKKPSQPAERTSIWQKLHRPSKPKSSFESVPKDCPEPWQCVVHLKLMKTFARAKQTVVEHLVGASALQSLRNNAGSNNTSEVELLLREQAWQIYLEQAFSRFEKWWMSIALKDDKGEIVKAERSAIETSGYLETLLQDTKPFLWTETNIPPLDVIMTLHSFMLNPRRFLEDCIRHNMMSLWKAGMPWKLLNDILDTSTNQYVVSLSARSSWTKTTGCPWDIHESDLSMTYPCPACGNQIVVGRPDGSLKPLRQGHLNVLNAESTLHCASCNTTFKDQHLHAHKFRTFVEDLQRRDTPMPGTVLSANGLAKSPNPDNYSALNTLLSGELGTQILTLTAPSQMLATSKPTLSDLTTLISSSPAAKTNPAILHALRRTTALTTDSHTQFALSLPHATSRQVLFTNTMDSISWLHSPSLPHTLSTLTNRYKTFFQIMRDTPSQMAVPTHAVDLAWHTHQLSPWSYYTFSLTNADGVFIDHDDRIAETTRTDAFDWTVSQYATLTAGADYTRCLCWYCATADSLSDRPLQTGEHGHVALDPGSDLDVQACTRIAAAQFAKLNEDFEVAGRIAGRAGKPMPDRKEFWDSYVWLYPRAVPVVEK